MNFMIVTRLIAPPPGCAARVNTTWAALAALADPVPTFRSKCCEWLKVIETGLIAALAYFKNVNILNINIKERAWRGAFLSFWGIPQSRAFAVLWRKAMWPAREALATMRE
ncbi:MAG TPA: hypothetical protein PK812_02820 [Beijerinckiaceae bacterium]|nr:hypothetical protein [Beijerinckiaceae bacterium]